MALKLNFREVTPEDTEILRMIALRNGKAEDYLCCDVTNEDGVTQTTWYSKADVALWGEDYIRAHTTMERCTGITTKKEETGFLSPNPYLAGGPCQRTGTKAPAHRDPLLLCRK